MKYEIITIGGCCLKDIFIKAPSDILYKGKLMGKRKKYIAFPYGDKIPVSELFYDFGGCSFNAAANFSNLGVRTGFATILGDDSLSDEALLKIKERNIGTDFLSREKNNYLGFSTVLIGEDGDRTILTYRAKNNFSKIKINEVFKKTNAIYLAGINKYSAVLQEKIYKEVLRGKKDLYINPSNFQIRESKELLKKLISVSRVVAMNMNEALEILGARKKEIRIVLSEIKKLGAEKVIITNGARGAYYLDNTHSYRVGLYPSKRVSSAGSGDAFFSSFVAAQIKDYNIEESLMIASISAGSIVESYGAQRNLIAWPELNKKIKENKVRVTKF